MSSNQNINQQKQNKIWFYKGKIQPNNSLKKEWRRNTWLYKIFKINLKTYIKLNRIIGLKFQTNKFEIIIRKWKLKQFNI